MYEKIKDHPTLGVLYRAIKANNLEQVQAHIAATEDNIRKSISGMSIAECLGYENDQGAVEFCEVNNLIVSRAYDEIAMGAARGGHRGYAERLRTQHSANVIEIAFGAARGGYKEYAEFLLSLEYDDSVGRISYGAACGGDRDYAEELRARHNANINIIARGAARGGHIEYAEHLRTEYNANVDAIAMGAAHGGYRDYAEELRAQHRANVDHIVAGAARGGDRAYTELLIRDYGACITRAAMGATLGYHKDYAEYLRRVRHARIEHILRAANSTGYEEYAEMLRPLVGQEGNVNDQGRAVVAGGGPAMFSPVQRPEFSGIRVKCNPGGQLTEEQLVIFKEVLVEEGHFSNWMCPVTFALFAEPCIASDGETYEYAAIHDCLKVRNRSPVSNTELDNKNLIPNNTLARAINAQIEQILASKQINGKPLQLPNYNGDGAADVEVPSAKRVKV